MIKDYIDQFSNNKNIRGSVPLLTKSEEEEDNEMICPKHNKKYQFFCKNCQKPLCPDCLFEEYTSQNKVHNGHRIEKVVDKKQEAKDQLKKEIKQAKALRDNIENQLQSTPDMKAALASQKSEIEIEMYNTYRDFQRNIESISAKNEKKLLEKASAIDSMIDDTEKIVDMASAIVTANDVGVFLSSKELVAKIDSFAKSPPPYLFERQSYPDTNYVCPQSSETEFDFSDFTSMLDQNHLERGYIYTPEFKAFGARWRGKLYPNGNGNGAGTHISMFLEVLKGFDRPFQFNYQVKIIHPTQDTVLERHFVSEFQNLDSWGWNRLASLNVVKNNGYIFPDNKLRIQIKLSPTTYSVLTEIYLDILERKRAKLADLKMQANEKKLIIKDNENTADDGEKDLPWKAVESSRA
ncbi:MATH domain containing protein [Trichomonas vaginalis G3]|uniref:MATH domain containing protein n=1 Tax=Trichomonas vaginalis (strain ATCC PRA-98 / G3) TaxID=412133 RepID=A2FHD0_TRIV3|nr:zinc ion binding [Trichomonas vaginalis G3]EAX95688.1 MATH domain containing protein [Trichomonas vaginalis G3]KAI5546786.1 zinc ion binding [Trichomonas vaginalis G3]|eukprot:XP_001308618.1 MATH domain containing protein [Trichomonas vaginalis G3]